MTDRAGDARRILITGSEGLVGTALRARLVALGYEVAGLDLRAAGVEFGDVRDAARLAMALRGCVGVVHLAAVSRVVWGERDPDRCWDTNVGGVRNLLLATTACAPPPWVLFASSREVYGQADELPVTESAPLRPMNVYARTKVAGEALIADAQARGTVAAIVRLSNVYGSPTDHVDRVVPAFVRAALSHQPMRVEGSGGVFDFTHVDDVSDGLARVVRALERGTQVLPPVHLLTGVSTTLGDLAETVTAVVGDADPPPWVEAPARTFDVARFVGDPARAATLYQWRATIALREGVARLAAALRRDVVRTA